jgi:hypothetical protein
MSRAPERAAGTLRNRSTARFSHVRALGSPSCNARPGHTLWQATPAQFDIFPSVGGSANTFAR